MHSLGAASILPALAALCLVTGCGRKENGRLELTIVDGDTSEVIAARVALRRDSGEFVVPDEALPVFGDCGQAPFHNWVPAAAPLQSYWAEHRSVENPFRGSTDFYTSGALTTWLRPGHYRVRVEKGPEYRAVEEEFVVPPGGEHDLRVSLRRWTDLPAQGWYSSDDHLHIPRPDPRFDPAIATWMQAEDIHVANMLQMGLARDVQVTPQRAFGPRSIYQAGRTLLVGGQENPRTHVFGHSIILGAKRWIDFPEAYLLYDRVWREAHRQGALGGCAHWAMGGAQDGLVVWGHEELIDFIEVLNLGIPYYKSWYEALNLGIRVVPAAGTDYPCLPTLPGRERFYARLAGPLTLDGWLDAVHRGRTFITNGPAIEFAVEGAGIGDTLVLDSPRVVRVRARVRFDPARDRVERVEIVQAGEVITSREQGGDEGEIAIDVPLPVSMSTWLAARASGHKVGELPAESIEPLLKYVSRLNRRADRNLREELGETAVPGHIRPSAAHTAPIYIEVRGTPPIQEQPRAREVARAWLDILADLANRLDEDHLEGLARFPGQGDGVTLEILRQNRAEFQGTLAASEKR
jgi:hypothetical protein